TSNAICPTYARTPLVENQVADQARVHGISEAEVADKIFLALPAIKRFVEPTEIAELVAFLCTPGASFITGASLPLDGGASIQ
ncbi:MAG: SDR family oxidoreductase, partial [Acidimicrobiaceae bacterium]|nr:SDR family oxidoreductase [Acidimicrobiaceae bacterium]